MDLGIRQQYRKSGGRLRHKGHCRFRRTSPGQENQRLYPGSIPAANSGSSGDMAIDSAGNAGYLNDLWKYDRTNNEWTWVSGSNTVNQAGIYGTKGTAAVRQTSPGQGSRLYPGSIPVANSGSSGELAMIRQATRAISMTCGSMTGRPMNGPGYPAVTP